MSLLFVSISDLHLGEELSLLTNLKLGEPVPEPRAPGPCLTALINLLHTCKSKMNGGKRIPYLILNGDILELAISPYPLTVTYFRLFLAQVASRELFDQVVLITGNHDHALWSLIRDTHFIEAIDKTNETKRIPALEHTTMLSRAKTSAVMKQLTANLNETVAPLPVLVANPAYRLNSCQGHDFIFHHGHFMEDLYKVLSMLKDRITSEMTWSELKKQPLRDSIEEIEKENWTWIDFIWSGLCRSGRVGETTEDIYKMLKTPEGMHTFKNRIAKILTEEFNIPLSPEFIERIIFRWLLKYALEQAGIGSEQRKDPGKTPFNREVRDMLARFVTHYIRKELKEEGYWPAENKTSFLFGHTHKPFLDEWQDSKFGFGTLTVANSGGWVVDALEDEKYKGAGIILGSNNSDMALIKYSISENSKTEVFKKGDWDRTLDLLPERKELASAISAAVKSRRKHLKKRTDTTKKILNNL